MLHTVLLNVTITWIFAILLIFLYSKSDFEKGQIEKVKRSIKNFTVVSDYVPNKKENVLLNGLIKDIKSDSDKKIKEARNHNITLLSYAVIIAIILIGLSSYAIYKERQPLNTVIWSASVGIILLITEVLLYLILFKTYDYGTEEYIYDGLSQVSQNLACRSS